MNTTLVLPKETEITIRFAMNAKMEGNQIVIRMRMNEKPHFKSEVRIDQATFEEAGPPDERAKLIEKMCGEALARDIFDLVTEALEARQA